MPSIFEQADERVAAAIGRNLGEMVIWTPMRPARGGVQVSGASLEDAERPTIHIRGIVTWRSSIGATVQGTGHSATSGGGVVGNASLMVDFESTAFETTGIPRKGDRFDLPDEPEMAGRYAEVQRSIPDGSRTLCHCSIVR